MPLLVCVPVSIQRWCVRMSCLNKVFLVGLLLGLWILGLHAVGVLDAEMGARKFSRGISIYLTIPVLYQQRQIAWLIVSLPVFLVPIFFSPLERSSLTGRIPNFTSLAFVLAMMFNGLVFFNISSDPLVPDDHPAIRQLYRAVFPTDCSNWTERNHGLLNHTPLVKSKHKKVLNLIFHMDPRPNDHGGNIFETDWIELVLLGEIDRPLRVLRWDNEFRNDSVHVIFGHPPDDLFFRMRRAGIVNFGSIQMADEFMVENTSFYADCDYPSASTGTPPTAIAPALHHSH